MSIFKNLTALLILGLTVFAYAGPAQAQATRTWISGVGDDVNPCSRTAPCKTFAGAISKTAAGGEISVLDPGGFGAVTITKSISLVAEGVEGSILGVLTNGIIINAGPADVVSIRGVLIEGGVSGVNGIRVLNAAQVHIENVMIRGFRSAGNGNGIDVQSPAATRVHVRNTSIYHNNVGINVKATGTGANNVFVEGSTIQSNGTAGRVDGAKSIIAMTDSVVTGGPGITILNSGVFRSFGDNVITQGDPTETSARK